ncbi:MAG: hypothetical protein KatS3mg118_1826 [Paracoccaceae bacterium]|nr:MAG: hypothetical protein KatS3mg118_1826 [Paracoccaceae bacterium]
MLGVRPEHVTIGEGRAARVGVRVVEPTGHETIVIAELPGGALVTARAPARARPAIGEVLPLGLDPDGLHLFAADEEGARIDPAR